MVIEMFWAFTRIFNLVVFIYFVILNLVYLATSLMAFFALKKYAYRRENLNIEEIITSHAAPPITLLAPSHNEEATVVESTKSLLALIYPEYEILLVNDGSTDATLARLIESFEMIPASRMPIALIPSAKVKEIYHSRNHPNLWLIDKENGGKADALNCGLNYCRTPLFCAMDADSLLERDSLKLIVRPFLEDRTTVAAGGIIRIVNGCTVESGVVSKIRLPQNWLARFQVLEYLRAFLSGRMGWSVMDATLIISGAFGLFRRSVVVDACGFNPKTVGEDMDLIVRLHRHCREKRIPYRITFVPDPVAWTECPETLEVLGRQRDRWQRGLTEVLLSNIKMLFNPRYGRIGLLAYPYFFFLEMMGPVIELLGYVTFAVSFYFGRISALYMVAFFLVAFVLGVALSVAAVGLEELSFRRYPRFSDILRLFFLAMIENFGYRQILTYWRVLGVLTYFRKNKSWGKMERKGYLKKSVL